MAKQRISVELDDETIRDLAVLGEPTEVLAHLAKCAADGVRLPGRSKREKTDESLQVERHKTDVTIAEQRAVTEAQADYVVRVARERADEVVQHAAQTARDNADGQRGARRRPQINAEDARTVLEHERSSADAVLADERSAQGRQRADLLDVERRATDSDLSGERTHADATLVDLREANERMVSATIRAHELADEAAAATERAEQKEHELRVVAEFREMFIGMLGHDLRSPLASIVVAAASLLRRGNLGEQDAETAGRIIRSGQRMTRMIAQLLDLTRARLGGGLPIEPGPTDLRDVCRDVVEEFEVSRIQLKLEGELTGSWDKDRLEEALSNLVSNAMEYAAPGTTVVAEARADVKDVVVEIRNQGEPIPADAAPFIFEPFHRARQHEKSASGNLGLGLYIAKQIVLSHGGTLEGTSFGGTTSFTMRLPRKPPISMGSMDSNGSTAMRG